MQIKSLFFYFSLSLLVTVSSYVNQSRAMEVKVGILAPKGTTWANSLDAMTKEIYEKTQKNVEFKIFYGGVKGDEPVVLQKIRAKQMQGGIFTGRTLGEINGDVRLMEVPFTFTHNRDLAWKTLEKMQGTFNKGFEKKQFKNLGFFEIGMVYLLSTKKADSFEQLKGLKIWSWQGDELASTLIQSMGLVSVPLALPDVLSSLSTGIIEACYAPPLAILAVQWQTKTKFLVDYPVTFSIGAFLISNEAWDKIPAQYKKTVEEISAKYLAEANAKTVTENVEALQSIKLAGLKFVNFPPTDIAKGENIRKDVISKLKGKMFLPETLALFEKTMSSLKK